MSYNKLVEINGFTEEWKRMEREYGWVTDGMADCRDDIFTTLDPVYLNDFSERLLWIKNWSEDLALSSKRLVDLIRDSDESTTLTDKERRAFCQKHGILG